MPLLDFPYGLMVEGKDVIKISPYISNIWPYFNNKLRGTFQSRRLDGFMTSVACMSDSGIGGSLTSDNNNKGLK